MFITLLTDYGPASEHVGVLHALIARQVPEVRVIDLAHDVSPGDVRAGSVAVGRLVPIAPVGIHVAVVDPGVGTDRRGVALRDTDGRIHIGPDNGLLTEIAPPQSVTDAVDLGSYRHQRPFATFDGRDVFVPAAIDLCAGAELDDLGGRIDPAGLIRLPRPESHVAGGHLMSEIVGVDRFGNVQLGLGGDALLAAGLRLGGGVWVTRADGERRHGVVARTFGDVPEGGLAVLVDSHGHLALAVNRGDASAFAGRSGARVWIDQRP